VREPVVDGVGNLVGDRPPGEYVVNECDATSESESVYVLVPRIVADAVWRRVRVGDSVAVASNVRVAWLEVAEGEAESVCGDDTLKVAVASESLRRRLAVPLALAVVLRGRVLVGDSVRVRVNAMVGDLVTVDDGDADGDVESVGADEGVDDGCSERETETDALLVNAAVCDAVLDVVVVSDVVGRNDALTVGDGDSDAEVDAVVVSDVVGSADTLTVADGVGVSVCVREESDEREKDVLTFSDDESDAVSERVKDCETV
jgi:hypothetical protein